MLLSNILLFAVGVVSFTVPKGQPDGVYTVFTNDRGEEVHIRLEPTKALPEEPPASNLTDSAKFLAKRGDDISGGSNTNYCGNYGLNRQDTDYAVGQLRNQCRGGGNVGKGKDFYSIRGCVVSYFCNFAGHADLCWESEVSNTARKISRVCGNYKAGWHVFKSNARYLQYGYENVCGQGGNFCGRERMVVESCEATSRACGTSKGRTVRRSTRSLIARLRFELYHWTPV